MYILFTRNTDRIDTKISTFKQSSAKRHYNTNIRNWSLISLLILFLLLICLFLFFKKKSLMEVFHGTAIRSVTCHMGSHSFTCYPTQVNTPRLNPSQTGRYSIYLPGGMEGWVDLVDLIAPRPGVEPATFLSRVQRSTNATSKTTA